MQCLKESCCMDKVKHGDFSLWVIGLCGLIYLLFPSLNNSNDAYMYAGDIKYGVDLFYPHHLLFNVLGYVFVRLFHISNTLWALCFINGIFAIGCLFLVRSILKPMLGKFKLGCILALLGCCWGFMRYATEGETYIIPLFFSLMASYVASRKQSVFRCSMLAASACLFHQIHVFWWMGLALFFWKETEKSERLKIISLYLLGAWIVPVAYLLVFYGTSTDCAYLYQYILHDYLFVDSVGFSFKQALILTPINCIRTFVQVHGYIYSLIKAYPFFLIGVCLSLYVFILGMKRRNEVYIIQRKDKKEIANDNLGQAHLWIALLQLVFAFLSNGNAEFMVMIPFALSIWFFTFYDIHVSRLIAIAGFLCLWNMSIGILPYHFVELYPYKSLEKYIAAHPNDTFVIEAYPQLFNQLRYNYPGLEDCLQDDMECGRKYLTDRYFNHVSFSRFTFTKREEVGNLLERNCVIPVDTLHYDLGNWIISQENMK